MALVQPKVMVVMPAYNAAKTIEKTYADIPKDIVSQILVVDDLSQDDTVEIAQRLGLDVVVHIQNRGYGGNQKTCYVHGLETDAEIFVMLHPDYQYDSRLIPELIRPIVDGRADLVLGSRFLDKQTLAGGMPLYKYISNRFLTTMENLVLRQNLSECHTGFRAYSRRFLETVPFVLNSDDFVFDTQIIVQAAAFDFKISEIAVPTRYFKEASSVNFRRSTIYGLATLGALVEFILNRAGLRRSPRYSKSLDQVISRFHRERWLRTKSTGNDSDTPPPIPNP